MYLFNIYEKHKNYQTPAANRRQSLRLIFMHTGLSPLKARQSVRGPGYLGGKIG